MSLFRTIMRTSATTIRPLHTTARRQMAYKHDQDRESLHPTANENSKSGTDEQMVSEHADVAFDPNTTRPEEAAEKTRKKTKSKGPEGEDALHASGANQEISKPLGDEKTTKTKGAGEEIAKGGSSGRGSAPKKGDLPKSK
ncbi:hypothetical protein SNK03_004937 [Fusarium graminearum]